MELSLGLVKNFYFCGCEVKNSAYMRQFFCEAWSLFYLKALFGRTALHLTHLVVFSAQRFMKMYVLLIQSEFTHASQKIC